MVLSNIIYRVFEAQADEAAEEVVKKLPKQTIIVFIFLGLLISATIACAIVLYLKSRRAAQLAEALNKKNQQEEEED